MVIYFKPIHTCRCLPFLFSHLNHCKKNIPFTQALRISNIVENQLQKLRHLSELKENLQNYYYPVNTITNGIKKALGIPQNELRRPKENKQIKFHHLFLYLNLITHLYINKTIHTIKKFQDLKVPNLLTVSNNHLTSRNCWLKKNLAMK